MVAKNRDLAILLGLFVGIAFVLHLWSAAAGHAFFRGLHLGAALEYAKGSIDLGRPVIVGFNANGAPTPQELPVWQAAAGLAMKIGGGWFGWANLVSLCIFLSSLWPMHRLASRVLGNGRSAGWVTVFFASQPLVVTHAGQASTDVFCLALLAWFLFAGCEALHGGKPVWWAAAVLSGALCAVSKLPFFMAGGLALAGVLVLEHRRDVRRWIALGGVGLVSAAVFAAWTHYTDSCLAAAEFPFIDLRISENPAMAQWYFGTLGDRLDPGIYVVSAWKFLNATMGSFALVAFPVIGLCARGARFPRVALLAAAVTAMVFFNLVTVHRHYYLMFAPAVALAAGRGATLIEEAWQRRREGEGRRSWAGGLLVPLVGACLLVSLAQGAIGMEVVRHYDGYGRRITGSISEHTGSADKLLVFGGGWGGDELFLSEREGLSLRSVDILSDVKALARLRELGYTKLICLSESPLLHALQVSNPGNQDRRRRLWRDDVRGPAAEWERVFSNEDILIARLPGAELR